MDKRARLISDLRLLSRRNVPMHGTSSAGSTQTGSSRVAGIMDSDDLDLSELREELNAAEAHMDGQQSEFGSDASESDEDLDAHLDLLAARELEALGAEALRNRQFQDARRFFALARLEGAERCARSLAMGMPVVSLDRAAVLDDWILAKYIEAANEEGPFVERHVLERQFDELLGRAAKHPAAAVALKCSSPLPTDQRTVGQPAARLILLIVIITHYVSFFDGPKPAPPRAHFCPHHRAGVGPIPFPLSV